MEEAGTIAFSAPLTLRKLFRNIRNNTDFAEVMYAFCRHCELDENLVDNYDLAFDKIYVKKEFVLLEYDCALWSEFALIVKEKAVNIEFYSRHTSEYVDHYFALTKDGKRISNILNVESNKEEGQGGISLWTDAVPSSLKKYFAV